MLRTSAPAALRLAGPSGTTTRSAATRTFRQALRSSEASTGARNRTALASEVGLPPCARLRVVNQLVRYVT